LRGAANGLLVKVKLAVAAVVVLLVSSP